ncbi:hypothetical protein [Mycobacterium sp.]|uniref:hypothetical protein n=1 Tax=Mycobacterium sp. TaxID=1785 RepID=UPI003F951325
MAGELPPNVGEGSTTRPPTEAWAPSFPTKPTPRSGSGRAIALTALALAAIAVVLAAAVLTVTFTHPVHKASSTASKVPTYTSAETSAAQQQLCDTYKLAARAVGVDTNGNNPAFARIALTNAAAMLDNADADPALDKKDRNAARALATAYRTLTAKSSSDAFAESEYREALDEVKAKDAAMKQVCGGS